MNRAGLIIRRGSLPRLVVMYAADQMKGNKND